MWHRLLFIKIRITNSLGIFGITTCKIQLWWDRVNSNNFLTARSYDNTDKVDNSYQKIPRLIAPYKIVIKMVLHVILPYFKISMVRQYKASLTSKRILFIDKPSSHGPFVNWYTVSAIQNVSCSRYTMLILKIYFCVFTLFTVWNDIMLRNVTYMLFILKKIY